MNQKDKQFLDMLLDDCRRFLIVKYLFFLSRIKLVKSKINKRYIHEKFRRKRQDNP